MSKPKPQTRVAAASSASRRFGDHADWRVVTLERMRKLIRAADPAMVEERKWKKATNPSGVPVWSHDGIVCTGETYKNSIKLTFMRGAALPDPERLFNAGLEGGTRRAIDIAEGETVDARAFKALIKAAVALNAAPAKQAKPVKLLAGGNPQIAKALGNAPVQAYIAAMPGWKRTLGQRLDALITRAVPKVRKAVKWNSPMYGIEGRGWFLSFHTFNAYVKVAFFRGTSLTPRPPGASKVEGTRYLDLHDIDELDERRFVRWVKQAAKLPGEWPTT